MEQVTQNTAFIVYEVDTYIMKLKYLVAHNDGNIINIHTSLGILSPEGSPHHPTFPLTQWDRLDLVNLSEAFF